MGPDTLTTTRENQTFSSVTPPWEMVRAPIYESGACSFRVAGVRSVLVLLLVLLPHGHFCLQRDPDTIPVAFPA